MSLHPRWPADWDTDEEYYLLLRKKRNGSVTLTDPANFGAPVHVWVGFAAKSRARLWAWLHGYRTEEVKDG